MHAPIASKFNSSDNFSRSRKTLSHCFVILYIKKKKEEEEGREERKEREPGLANTKRRGKGRVIRDRKSIIDVEMVLKFRSKIGNGFSSPREVELYSDARFTVYVTRKIDRAGDVVRMI